MKNKKPELEADALNTFANKGQVDELFRRLKSDNSTFLDANRKQKCDSNKLKEHFKHYFNIEEDINEPFELNEALEFVKELQQVDINGINMSPPNFDEIRHIPKNLKNSNATLKTQTNLLGKWTNCIERYGLQMVSPNLGSIQSLLPYGKDLLKENYLIRLHIEDCK